VKNDTFSNRLKMALKIRNMRAIDLVNKTGLSKALISSYVNDKSYARQDKISIIAKALEVNESWLMGFNTSMDREWLPYEDGYAIDNKFNVEIYKIPVVECDSKISELKEYSNTWETIDIPINYMRGGNKFLGIKVMDDSMKPDYLKDDILLVIKNKNYNSYDDCIVSVGDENMMLRRIIKTDNGIKLKPLNNDYDTKIYSNDDIQKLPVNIIGVVKEVRRKK